MKRITIFRNKDCVRCRRFARVHRLFDWFNRNFDAFRDWYQKRTSWFLKRTWPVMIAYAVIVAILVGLFLRLPTGFLPDEDQGVIITQITLPVGAVQERTLNIAKQVSKY